MSFCTSIHCMDGRIQEPTINYLKQTYGISYFDAITEPGPCKILAENTNKTLVDSILNRINISVNKHGSKLIAISGHYDCASNPCGEEEQKEQTKQAIEVLKNSIPKQRSSDSGSTANGPFIKFNTHHDRFLLSSLRKQESRNVMNEVDSRLHGNDKSFYII